MNHPITSLPQKWNCGMIVTVFPFRVIQPCKKWVTSHTVEERIVTSAWADARPHTGKTRRDIRSNSTARWGKALVHCEDIVMEFVNEVFRCKWIDLRAQHLPASQEWPPWCPRCDVGLGDMVCPKPSNLITGHQKRVGLHYTVVRHRFSHLEANNSFSQKWVVHMESTWRKWDSGSRM
jgi:hypothetical protein